MTPSFVVEDNPFAHHFFNHSSGFAQRLLQENELEIIPPELIGIYQRMQAEADTAPTAKKPVLGLNLNYEKTKNNLIKISGNLELRLERKLDRLTLDQPIEFFISSKSADPDEFLSEKKWVPLILSEIKKATFALSEKFRPPQGCEINLGVTAEELIPPRHSEPAKAPETPKRQRVKAK